MFSFVVRSFVRSFVRVHTIVVIFQTFKLSKFKTNCYSQILKTYCLAEKKFEIFRKIDIYGHLWSSSPV